MKSINKFYVNTFVVVMAMFVFANGLPTVTNVCLGCICETVSGCNTSLTCDGSTCGLFAITHAYWADSGKPTLRGQSPDSKNAYPDCANNPVCAVRTIQGYMTKFGQDCNGDGVINCYDHMAIHHKGKYGCREEFTPGYFNDFNTCIAAIRSSL